MARKSRLFIPGLPHLIQLRGHNGERLFRDDADFSLFLNYMSGAAARYRVELYGWALAERRILLLIGAPDKEAPGRFIQHLGRRYVPWYNRRYQRRGALWENRYQSSPLEPEAYFLLVKKYIERQEDGIQGLHSLGDEPVGRVALHPLWMHLGADEEKRRANYRHFCQTPPVQALNIRIKAALEQNCLLATPPFSRQLERRLKRSLQARHSGRPRKHIEYPLEQWNWLEQQAECLLQQWGYQQIRLPLLERPALFSSGGPELRGDVALRSDGTTGCLRLLAHEGHLPATARLWYSGAMFRLTHRSPHVCQLHQVGVEAFGMAETDIELELLMMQASFFNRLGLSGHVELHLNTLGDADAIVRFRAALHDYYHPLAHLLPPELQRTLRERPERLIHHTDVLLQRLAQGAPKLEHFVTPQARARFLRLLHGLSAAGVPWQYAPQLFLRHAYGPLVFEWRSAALPGAPVVARGGRYDSCASDAVGRPIFACGFAFMLEAIMQLIAHTQRRGGGSHRLVDVAIIASQSRAASRALLLGRRLRQQFPQLSVINDCSAQRLATRYKNARRLGARFIVELEGDGETLQVQDTRSLLRHPATFETLTGLLAKSLMT